MSLPKLIFLLIFIFSPALSSAKFSKGAQDQEAPHPPWENPHPPQTQLDKDRVAFGESAIQILKNAGIADTSQEKVYSIKNSQLELNIDLACLESSACLQNNKGLLNYLFSIQSTHGGILAESRHTHLIPWSLSGFNKTATKEDARLISMAVNKLKPDQYLLHSYVRFLRSGVWYNLDIVVSEDAQGHRLFQRFYLFEIQSHDESISPGDKC